MQTFLIEKSANLFHLVKLVMALSITFASKCQNNRLQKYQIVLAFVHDSSILRNGHISLEAVLLSVPPSYDIVGLSFYKKEAGNGKRCCSSSSVHGNSHQDAYWWACC